MTIKQKKFVQEYIKNNGNGTKAALAAYDTNDYNTAHSIASENLQKPTIRKALRLELERKGISLDYVLDKVRQNMEAGVGVKATATDSLRAAETLLKVMGAYPNQNRTEIQISTRARYEQMTKQELITEQIKIDKEIKQLLTE